MSQDAQIQPVQSATLHSVPVPPRKISYEEFLRSCEYSWAEWVDGEVIVLTPPATRHQLVALFLVMILKHWVDARRLGVIIPAPFQMKTGPQLAGREPDLLFIANEHLERLKATHLAGPADLAVEVISPESLSRDRGDKFFEYEQGGVTEYWLIDPIRRLAEFYVLDNGAYRPARVDDDGIYRSTVMPGLWLRVEWLWQEPLPTPMSVLKEWGLVS